MFFIKYGYFRALNKIKTVKEFGWKNRNIRKCHFSQITKYLNKIDAKDLSFFNKRIVDYLNLLIIDGFNNQRSLIPLQESQKKLMELTGKILKEEIYQDLKLI